MTPLNNHLMIQPLETDSFMATQKTTYEEVGIVLIDNSHSFRGLDDKLIQDREDLTGKLVYFDSWLAKKFPVKGKPNEFVWFVKDEDIVAYEPVPE